MRSNRKVLGSKSESNDKLGQTLLLAKELWPRYSSSAHDEQLKLLVGEHGLSLAAGDLLLIDGKLYVSHAGLLRIAKRKRCSGIQTEAIPEFCDPRRNRWVVKATVFKSATSKGFVGYGDADPAMSPPSSAAPRCAWPRHAPSTEPSARPTASASARSMRLAVTPSRPFPDPSHLPCPKNGSNGDENDAGNGQPRLRDRLCLLIRQHNLDATQVKRYAADFCQVGSLRYATREQIEQFLRHLTELATQDRDKLRHHLEAYADHPAQPQEAA